MSSLNETRPDEKNRRDPGFFCRSGQPRCVSFRRPVIKEAWIEARTPEDAELLEIILGLVSSGFTLEHAAEVALNRIESEKRLSDKSLVELTVEWAAGHPQRRNSDQDGK